MNDNYGIGYADRALAAAKMQPPVAPNYTLTFNFEDRFDVPASIQWFHDYYHVPFIISLAIYLPVLYFGQILMANREPMKLKVPLILWNSALAIFSIIGFSRSFPEFIYTLRTFGVEHTMCNNSFLYVKPVSFWFYLFVLSKTPELVDTLFLVLKKQNLIFLHVYHHASVLLFSWGSYANSIAAARWFYTMNYGVHALMYSYYALKAMPSLVRIPKWVSMIITSLQTLQMVAGTYVVLASSYYHMTGRPCATNFVMSVSGVIIYVSYLILFSHFFYKAYCSPGPSKSREATSAGKKNV